MKLTYNNLRFDLLANYIRVVDEKAVGDPADSPKRWRKTLGFEVDFNEETFKDNRGLLDQIRKALSTQKAVLLWQDDQDTTYLNRTVEIVEHNLPLNDEKLQRGSYWQQLKFTVAYWDNSVTSQQSSASYKRTGAGSDEPAVDLGDVDEFDDAFNSELMNRMRDVRGYVGGRVTMRGRIKADTTLTLTQRRAGMQATYAALLSAFKTNASGRLLYGVQASIPHGPVKPPLFDHTVRVIDFLPRLADNHDFIDYSLTASYTRYPNEADYALMTYKVAKQKHHENGTYDLVISGKIGAPSEDLARAQLAALRTSVTQGGSWVLGQETGDAENVASLENSTTAESGDGSAFTELNFNDVYHAHLQGLVTWSLRISTSDSAPTGLVRAVYAGSVQAFGDDYAGALAVANAQADTLALGNYGLLLNFSRTPLQRQQNSGGKYFLNLDFSYEYLTRSPRLFLEARGELNEDRFGDTTETVSGFVQAPDLATAQSIYETYVRNQPGYVNLLLLSERTPTQNYQRLIGGDSAAAGQSIWTDVRAGGLTSHANGATFSLGHAPILDCSGVRISSNPVTVLVEGKDFSIDRSTGTVTKLSDRFGGDWLFEFTYTVQAGVSLDDRFDFSFTVFRTKTIASCSYKLTTSDNVIEMTRLTNISGNIHAPNAGQAEAYLDGILTGLSLGLKISGERGASRRKGRNLGDSADVDVFIVYEFNETYEQALTGITGILQSACTEQIQYSGTRCVERPIVDGVSVIQHTGTSAARRNVQGMVRAITPQGCEAYARKVRGLLLSGGAHETAPQISKKFVFAQRVEGIPLPAESAGNAKYYEWEFNFSELVAELLF